MLDTVATNTARDLGARLMALTIWGSKASGGSYAAIAALTNIVATLVAIMFYEFMLADSSRGKSCLPIRQPQPSPSTTYSSASR